jgi:hypothetical protein
MNFGNIGRYSQSQAGPVLCVWKAMESLEDPFSIFLRNPGARVMNLDDDSVSPGFSAYFDTAFLGRMSDCVVQYVSDHFNNQVGIATDFARF